MFQYCCVEFYSAFENCFVVAGKRKTRDVVFHLVSPTVGGNNDTGGPMSVTNSDAKKDTDEMSPASLKTMESLAQSTYRIPGRSYTNVAPRNEVEWVRNTDGTLLIDHCGRPITVDRILATKPLRGELSSRPGPGNRKLTYLSGEGVTRTLNDIFGFDGWNLDIKNTQREVRSLKEWM